MSSNVLVHRGTEIPVSGTMVLGRSKECDVVVGDKLASRKHVTVALDAEGRAWAEDLGSANGTKINGKRFTGRVRLRHGDRITIGQNHLVYQDRATMRVSKKRSAPRRPEALLGQLVSGYRVQSIIGQGAMGTVYRARQLALDRPVAIKVFRADVLEADATFADRFLEEARIAGSIGHEGLANIHECGRDSGLLWYSMELVEGETLADLIRRDGRLDPALALLILERIGRALQACHERRIIHGDLKPVNVMITPTGGVKLLDMGLARILQEGRQSTEKSAVVGTPAYMSPEAARNEDLDQRSDIYSLGCTFVHMLLGQPPYVDRDPLRVIASHLDREIPRVSAQRSELPSEYDDLVQGMLAKNPEWRFQNMGECLQELSAIRKRLYGSDRRPAQNAPAPRPAPARRSNQRPARASDSRPGARPRRRVTNLALVVLILVGAGIALLNLPLDDHPDPSQPDPVDRARPEAPGTETPHAITPTDPPPDRPEDAAPSAQRKLTSLIAAVDVARREHEWSKAAYAIRRFMATHRDGESEALRAATNLLRQLQADANRWTQRQLATLPPANRANLRQRLLRLTDIRNKVLAPNRSEVETLYTTTLRQFENQLALARRKAEEHLKAGEMQALAAVPERIAPLFAGTPAMGLFRQFASRVEEASRLELDVDWQHTERALASARGEQALAAASALLLLRRDSEAMALLLENDDLASGQLRERRDRLLRAEALMLDFTDPAALAHFESEQGRLVLRDGALTAERDPCAFTCTAPLNGDTWECAFTLVAQPMETATIRQFSVSLVAGGRVLLALLVDPERIRLRAALREEDLKLSETVTATRHRIRILCHQGGVRVLRDDAVLVRDLDLPLGQTAQLDFNASGMDWRLEDLRLITGD